MNLLSIKFLGAWSGVIAGILLFIVITVCYFLLTNQPDNLLVSDLASTTPVDSIDNKLKSNKNTTRIKKKTSLEDRLVKELQDLYGDTISEKSTQVLLLKTKRYILRLYPKDGLLRFYNIIKRAFPDLVDEIMKTLEAMEQYLLWEVENSHLLSQMNTLEKEGHLWEKRKELFGDEAENVWSKDVEEYQKRKKDMQDTISRLDKSYDSTIYEKLTDYQETLNNIYENTTEAYILESKDLLAKVFLGLDSVQGELKEMTPEVRKTELSNIRSEMGYTQAQIEQLEKIDNKKNSRWDNGLAYMSERDNIAQELEGAELDTALKTLREKYFKHEAKTIEIEEKDGFFRYTRRRIYGKN